MGVCGLWCFIVGYARLRNDLRGFDMLVSFSRSDLPVIQVSMLGIVARRIAVEHTGRHCCARWSGSAGNAAP